MMKYKLMLIFILFLTNIGFSDISSPEKEYLHQKEMGNYEKALDILQNWTAEIDNPYMIEANIFRIYEIMIYPELFKKGIDALNKISSNKIFPDNPFLKDRIDVVKNLLLLKTGDLKSAQSIIDSLHYLNFYAIGPFKNSSSEDFEKNNPVEKEFNQSQTYKGKNFNISWFKTRTDRTGFIDLENLYSDISDSLFYFYREINIQDSGEYNLILGKTGFTDIWLDGEKIFSNRKQHGFLSDQYVIKVFLPAGAHKILIKTGNSNHGIKVSLRISGAQGNRIKIPDHVGNNADSPGRLIKSTLFPSLELLVDKKDRTKEESFITGYLYYISNIGIDDNNEALEYLSELDEMHDYYSSSCYYIGQIEKGLEKKEESFKKSIQKNPDNIEALTEIIWIKLENRFFYEAYPFIEKIKKIDNNSPYYLSALTKLSEMRGWNYEASASAAKLKKSAYPSIGYYTESHQQMSDKNYTPAARNLEYMYKLDQYNKSYILSLINCYESSGKYDEAIKALYHAVTFFPNSVIFKLRLADIIENRQGIAASIPYISSALNISPYNKNVLNKFGILYHKLNSEKLARYYLEAASTHDPDNFSLKLYLKIISMQQNEIQKYLNNEEIPALIKKADKYKDEPAVTLLNETAMRVNIDGSYEKWVRKIYKINDKSAIDDFKSQYIIIDPMVESVENLKCVLINDNSRIEISEKYKKSLSDPESRLYYNLEAVIIPIASIKKGSILDISYTINNKSGKEYKNYFGERITIDGKYRILNSNIILSCPDHMQMFYYLRKIDKNSLFIEKKMQKTIYRLVINDTSSYKKEAHMPSYTEMCPTIYFTTMKSWDNIYLWYKSLLKNKIVINSEIRTALNKIISEKDSKLDKIRKIYSHITNEIRYVGFEFGMGGIQPRSTDVTYHSKMGDCKDVSLLLVAMLRAAGIDSKIALVRTRDRGRADMSIPYIGEFNHAICYVNLESKKSSSYFFIDGTAKETGFKEIPADDRNIIAFVIDETSNSSDPSGDWGIGYKFINTESKYYDENFIKVTNEMLISSNGNALLKRDILKQGNEASSTRVSLKNTEKKFMSLNEYWNQYYPGSTVEQINIISSSLEKPAVYSYSVKIPSFAQVSDEEIIFNAFLVQSNYYQEYAMSKNRKFSVELRSPWTTEIINTYIIPEGYKIFFMPKNENFSYKSFKAAFIYSEEKNIIKISSIITFNSYNIDINEYDQFRNFTRFINKKEMERIVLIKKKE